MKYLGTSTDTKPDFSFDANYDYVGSEFAETDTKDVYTWTGTAWTLSPETPISGTVTVNNGSGVKLYDENSATYKGLYFNAEAPQVCAQPYLYAVAEGDITGHTNYTKYGRVTVLTTSPMDVWPLANTYTFPSTDGQGLRIISTSTKDTSTGTGAQKIKIEGLSTGYLTQTTEVSTNGQTAVTIGSTNFTRVNKIYISQSGTDYASAGNIDIYSTGGTTSPTYGRIETGLTQSRQLVYTVPSNKTLYITSVRLSAGVSTANKFQYVIFTTLASVDPGTGAKATLMYPFNEIGLLNNAFELNLESPTKIPATADLKIRVHADTTSGSICTAAIRGWIE